MSIYVVVTYETSFSRLSTKGPQTPGKLHEPSLLYDESIAGQATYTSVIPIDRANRQVHRSLNAAQHLPV